MKLTIYCDKDLVLRYSPDQWPYYDGSLQIAKDESVPFEDQKEVLALIPLDKIYTYGVEWGDPLVGDYFYTSSSNEPIKPDTFYNIEVDGVVEVAINVAKIIHTNRLPDKSLLRFYEWYREANAATREDFLNELKRILEIEL